MYETSRSRLVAYGVAVLATGGSLLLRLSLVPWLDYRAELMTFFPAIILSAYLGGLEPGLVATLLGAAAGRYFLIEPRYTFEINSLGGVYTLGLFALAGAVISGLTESLHRSRRRITASERRYAVTLASIGDAVLATDTQARVTFLNPAAEALTGWRLADAVGRPLAEVFRIVHEQTRQPAEDPAGKALRTGTVVGLVNPTALLARDGRETPIDDGAAPIIDDRGRIAGVVLVFRDVSGRRRAEEAEAFRRANERLELAVRGSNVGVWEVEMPDGDYQHGRRHYMNVWEQLGYERPPDDWANGSDEPQRDDGDQSVWTDTAASRPPRETAAIQLHPDDRGRFEEAIRRYLAGETDEYEAEARFLRKDGSHRTMLARGFALRDFAGRPVRFTGILLDITKLKAAEDALRESEQRWRSLTEALPQLVWSAAPDGACDYFSTQWTEHTGIEEADLLGWGWLETLHPEDRERTRQFWLESVAGHHAYDVEYRVRRGDGDYRWFKTRGVPIRDGGGNIVKWFGTCTDITDLRQTEEELRASERRFRGTFENATVGMIHTDPTGRYLRVNETFCAIVGFTREELLQKTPQDLTHPDDLAANVTLYTAMMRGESPGYGLEKRYIRKDGAPVWVELFAAPQRDAAGRPAYAIAVIQDISERKRLDAELRQARDAAEAANRAKDEFLANVSHEIRTPMNAILGMTELALGTELTEDQRQCLRTVKSAADNLLSMINDLLDFAKIESGKLELDPADFSLRAAVGDILRALAVRAHAGGLELISDVHPNVPDALFGDAGRLRQVLLNLVSNAVKFTEQGEVVVSVQKSEDRSQKTEEEPSSLLSSDSCLLEFSVRDTGIGIPPDKQESIFRAFEQEDTSTTRKYGGTGLGLTIASRLVVLMGGEITVDSEPGRGSTFTFTARFVRRPQQPEPVAVPRAVLPDGLRVLVVDDNATNRHILVERLRGWRMEPAAVGDGLAVLDALWDAVSAGQPYPLVLLDARMPDTDGLELAAKVRKRAELSATRIILLTSGDRPGDLARSREQRLDARLLKPVQQDELLGTIYRVMRVAGGGWWVAGEEEVSTPATRHPPPATSLHILVAEDNEFNAQLLEQLLGRRGHRVRLAGNGREALALAEAEAFDLLLLDVHMPELDGFQVVRAVREREQTAGGHLPIVALTARSRKEDRERCLAAGMDDFLAKPIQAAHLWAAIDRVVGGRPPADRPGSGLIDPRVLLAACGGEGAILEKIGQTFRARLPDHLRAVQEALRDGNAPRLREAAHKLAGMVAAFSTVAGGVASELEDRAAQGQLEDSRTLVARLEAMAEELLRSVDGLSLDALRGWAAEL